jgi:hypothetical protein
MARSRAGARAAGLDQQLVVASAPAPRLKAARPEAAPPATPVASRI